MVIKFKGRKQKIELVKTKQKNINGSPIYEAKNRKQTINGWSLFDYAPSEADLKISVKLGLLKILEW